MSQIVVVLSYFHRKVGSSVFYSYPEDSLDRELSVKIANIMDLYNEGFFTHLFENSKTLNYYFEIKSEWARGNKEMLMVSTIINPDISPETEEKISQLFVEFLEKLCSHEEIFKAFYLNDLSYYERDKEEIIKNVVLLKASVEDLYWAIAEVPIEISEEGKLMNLLNFLKNIETEMKNKDEIADEDDENGEDSGYVIPYSPIPPGSPGAAGSAKRKILPPEIKAKSEPNPICEHCGSDLPKGQTICHVCGKKVN